jgi:hypothetical protein
MNPTIRKYWRKVTNFMPPRKYKVSVDVYQKNNKIGTLDAYVNAKTRGQAAEIARLQILASFDFNIKSINRMK